MHITDKTHARLGPSGWDWWSRCPGAPALTDGLPSATSIYAAEGTVAHEVADRVLRGDVDQPGALLGHMFQSDGYDIVVDDEMVEAVGDYLNVVREMVGDGILMPEQRVPIGHLTGEPGAEGTSDAIGIAGNRLIVIDLKYGKGVAVDAVGNGQGRIYALGALEKFGAIYDIEEVEIVIVQPRLDSVSSEILSVAALREFAAEVEIAAGLVRLNDEVFREGNELDLVPGEKQCKFCDAKGICPALKAEVSSSLAVIAASGPEDFADLTMPKQASAVAVTPELDNERLAEFMRAVPLIEEAIKGVRAEVERRLLDGQQVPGFYLGVGRKGNRKWAADDIEEQLKKRLGSAAYEKKLISVATAEKLFKNKPRTWAKIADLVVQDEGRPSVCKEGDKNPVYEPPHSKIEDFADLTAQSEADALLG